MSDSIVIAGAGMAAAYLVNAIRERRSTGGAASHQSLVLIGEESVACYNRILLSTALDGSVDDDELSMVDSGDDLELMVGRRVERVLPESRQVRLDDGSLVAYGKLVLATGSSVTLPDLRLRGIRGIHCFRTLDDLATLRNQQRGGEAKRVLVVGAGLLGLEAAWALRTLGMVVTVLHRNDRVLNRQLDVGGASLLEHRFRDRGIEFLLGTELRQVLEDQGAVTGVIATDGTRVDCDLLILATGITPNTGLSREARLPTDRGVLVNEWMETGDPHIYALGECAQFQDHTFGLVAPIKEQARVLAEKLLRLRGQPFSVEPYPTQLKISGLDVFSAGDTRDEEPTETITLKSTSRSIYRRLFIRGNRLVGAVLVGNRRGANALVGLMQNGTDIDAFRNQLMFGGFPESVAEPFAQ